MQFRNILVLHNNLIIDWKFGIDLDKQDLMGPASNKHHDKNEFQALLCM